MTTKDFLKQANSIFKNARNIKLEIEIDNKENNESMTFSLSVYFPFITDEQGNKTTDTTHDSIYLYGDSLDELFFNIQKKVNQSRIEIINSL